MAAQQTERHQLGRFGESIAKRLFGGRRTRHLAPFDTVDFNNRRAYETKTMSGFGKDLKIHISDSSMARKVKFAKKYNLEMILIAVVIYSPDHIEVYRGELRQCIRVRQMELVQGGK